MIIALKFLTGLMLMLGIFLIAEAFRLVSRIRRQSRVLAAAKPQQKDQRDDELHSALERLERDFVLVPRTHARGLISLLTQANRAGYDVINTLEKADIRMGEENIAEGTLSELRSEVLRDALNEREVTNAR